MSDDHYKHWQDAHYPNDPKRMPWGPISSSILVVVAGISSMAIVLWMLLFR